MDRKVKMMDAGTVIFTSAEPFGTTCGRVREKMAQHGPTFRKDDLKSEDIPPTAEDFDYFLDCSNPWRHIYITCLCESSGDKFAATFKEGNTTTPLRASLLALCIIVLAVISFSGCMGFWGGFAGIVMCLFGAYLWIVPSKKGRKTVMSLMDSLK